MTLFTTQQLETYYPTDTTADTLSTIALFQRLEQEGFFDDAQKGQIIGAIGTFIDTKAEAYTLASAVYTGTAGTTTRTYTCVPTYPLPPTPPEGTFTNQGIAPYLAMPGPPPQQYPGPSASATAANTYNGRQRMYGQLQSGTEVAVTLTAATLTAANYVTITAPAASSDSPGVLFDIVVLVSGVWYAVAFGVAPGGTATDNGTPYESYAMAPNTYNTDQGGSFYPHAEYGVDTVPETHVIIYGVRTYIPPGLIGIS